MKKVLVVADVPNWAFGKIYRGLRDNSSEEWEVDVIYLNVSNKNNAYLIDYDIVLYLCDNFPNPLINWINTRKVLRENVLLAIRSEVNHPLYEQTNLLNLICSGLVCSNDKLYNRFQGMHDNVYMVPGGVDTDKFYFQQRTFNDGDFIRLGWAGNVGEWTKEFRGLDIIENVANTLGRNVVFNPALRDDKWRTEEEMVQYFHNDIDIYVEMSKTAGRQNGLLEAGSCGVPVISYDCGVASQLIEHKKNGYICTKRNSDQLTNGIMNVMDNYKKYSKRIRTSVEEKWSWKHHTKLFEDVFNDVVSKVKV